MVAFLLRVALLKYRINREWIYVRFMGRNNVGLFFFYRFWGIERRGLNVFNVPLVLIRRNMYTGFVQNYNHHLSANLITFYEYFLIQRVFIVNRVINNSLDVGYHNLILKIYLSIYKILHRARIQLRWYNFVYMLVWAGVNKDLTILKNYLKTRISRVRFKKHKKFFNLLRYVYFCVFKVLIELGCVSGVIFKVSGKIGLAGSVKTKTLIFSYGRTRVSSKRIKLKFMGTQIWTRTGVLGVQMSMVY